MYKISIIAVGPLKEAFWKDAIAEYEKRLTPFAKVRVVDVEEVEERHLPKDAFVIALDLTGKQYSSEKFAEFLQREGEVGRELVFLIGGPHGLSRELVEKAHVKVSLSELTFTHGEARAILFEQLYRAMAILAGKTYHY